MIIAAALALLVGLFIWYLHTDISEERQSRVKTLSNLSMVHWMTFNFALHEWDEPIERALTAAIDRNVDPVTPKIGEIVAADQPFINERWWENVN